MHVFLLQPFLLGAWGFVAAWGFAADWLGAWDFAAGCRRFGCKELPWSMGFTAGCKGLLS